MVSLIDAGVEAGAAEPGPSRFAARWHFIGAGLSNVWRYTDLELPAPSGRLLLRGPNGTGKTTALETLWPYLLDLNARQLSAGKARTTNLTALMAEESGGKRRTGYAWVTFAAPGESEIVSYGVRLNYSPGASPPVGVVPFMVQGRPLYELALWKPGRESLNADEFGAAVIAAGGLVFRDEADYRHDLATRLFGIESEELRALTKQIHFVRNPTRLAELSADTASDQLCESLPTVEESRIEATADALAESETTRLAFERDREAASALEHFAASWVGHVRDAARTVTTRAEEAVKNIDSRARDLRTHARKLEAATVRESAVNGELSTLEFDQTEALGKRRGIEQSDLYKNAARLGDLERTMEAQESMAAGSLVSLGRAAEGATRSREQIETRAAEFVEDYARVAAQVRAVAPELETPLPLSLTHRPRGAMSIGNQTVDPGPELVFNADLAALAQSASAWTERAESLAAEGATAKLYEKAHAAVLELESVAGRARSEANRLWVTAQERAADAHRAAIEARAAAAGLEGAVRTWRAPMEVDPGFSLDDLAEGSWAIGEPAEALASAEELAGMVTSWANTRAVQYRTRAGRLTSKAEQLRADAAEAKNEAEVLRADGAVLPLPRPEWVCDVDDEHSFGAALVWNDDVPASVQDALEDALAQAGVLGAALEAGGVRVASWAVSGRGPRVASSLADVLSSVADHPMAEVASTVLARIELVEHASELDGATGALVIGRDGSFRAGPLVSRPSVAGREFAPATHVGAARRRAAALERAAELERNAVALEQDADRRETEAGRMRDVAEAALNTATAFPERTGLRDAEAARVGAARAEQAASSAAESAEAGARDKESEAETAAEGWRSDVGAVGLPQTIDALRQFIGRVDHVVAELRSAGVEAAGRLANRLGSLERDVRVAVASDTPAQLVAQARSDHAVAVEARAVYEELVSQLGSAAEDVMRAYEEVQGRIRQLELDVTAARDVVREATSERVRLDTLVETSKTAVGEARPAATRAVGELRELLAVEGVCAALLEAEPAIDDKELIAQVVAAAAGKTVARRTLLDQRDKVHAELVETWKVEPANAPAELLAFVLTNENNAYSPVSAAAHAKRQAERAQEALSLAQEDALSKFVVGAVPGAIATAWTRLQDWKRDVNNKMREAAASSGVGVSVRVGVREDLAPTERTLHELTCKGALSSESKRAAGDCIARLIDASSAEDMKDRVRDAVDIRNWVYVEYYVTRPGQEPKKWGKRTGLSGGERRLVVLAPMLAAIAAAYDKFGTSAPRLAALDEVPAEVDLAGREGLARYLAALDLDLVATSHEWDGAPGAWDGIDAQDLESATDGTVIAFHMPIRSREPLPGDSLVVYPAASASSDAS
ncbi:MAG: hypothetical protein JWO62_83 [Acidimicrobiaceae bacterium]|nr:hypothetical protein [Acidimicrobiaceae bacterium]